MLRPPFRVFDLTRFLFSFAWMIHCKPNYQDTFLNECARMWQIMTRFRRNFGRSDSRSLNDLISLIFSLGSIILLFQVFGDNFYMNWMKMVLLSVQIDWSSDVTIWFVICCPKKNISKTWFSKSTCKKNFENFFFSKKMWKHGRLEDCCLKFLFVDVIKFWAIVIWDVNVNH